MPAPVKVNVPVPILDVPMLNAVPLFFTVTALLPLLVNETSPVN